MGITIVAGGVVGTGVGMLIFAYLREKGVINVSITLAYIYMLVIIGTLMFAKGYKELTDLRKKIVIKRKAHDHYWIHGLPFRMKFHKSRLYESALVPIMLGFIVGIFCFNYGCWWCFFNGSCNDLYYWYANKISSRNIFVRNIFITGLVVIVHALKFQTIDFILVFILLIGSIIGLHVGLRISQKLNASEYKTLLAILLLAVGLIMGIETFVLEKGSSLFAPVKSGQIDNKLAEVILSLSTNNPITYGLYQS